MFCVFFHCNANRSRQTGKKKGKKDVADGETLDEDAFDEEEAALEAAANVPDTDTADTDTVKKPKR